MSQFNSIRDLIPGSLEGMGKPLASTSRARPSAPTLPLPAEQLNAPGVTPMPVTSRGAALAEQLTAVFGAAVGAADVTIRSGTQAQVAANRSSIESAYAAREQEKARDELDRAEKVRVSSLTAAGKIAVGEDVAILGAQIDSDGIKLEDGSNIEAVADDLLRKNIPEGASPEYVKAYMDGGRKPLLFHLERQKIRHSNEGKAELVTTVSLAAQGGTSEELQHAVDDIRLIDPRISDLDAKAIVGTSALKYAKETNDASAVGAVEAFAGNIFKTQIADARNSIGEFQARQRTAANATSRQSLYKLINDGEPVDRVLSVADKMRKAGVLEEDDFARMRHDLVNEQNRTRAIAQEKTILETDAANDAAAFMRGATHLIPEKETHVLADGRTIHRTYKERMDEAASKAKAQIAQSLGSDPKVAVSAQIAIMTNADYLDNEWSHLLESGAAQATSWNIEGDSSVPLPIATKQAVELYSQMKAAQSSLVYKIPESARKVLDSITLVQQRSSAGSASDIASAVLESRNLKPTPPVSDSAVAKASKEFLNRNTGPWYSMGADTVLNKREVFDNIKARANIIAAHGYDAETASARATKEFADQTMNINGWVIDYSKASLPPDVKEAMPAINKALVGEWIAANPKLAEQYKITPKNGVLTFNDTTGLWTLTNTTDGRPFPAQTPQSLHGLIVTLQAMQVLSRVDQKNKSDAAMARVVTESQVRNNRRVPSPSALGMAEMVPDLLPGAMR